MNMINGSPAVLRGHLEKLSPRPGNGRDGKTLSGAESVGRYPRQSLHGPENVISGVEPRPIAQITAAYLLDMRIDV